MCLLSDINQSENDGIFYSRPFEDIENNIEEVINEIKDTINNGDWEFRYVKTPNPLN